MECDDCRESENQVSEVVCPYEEEINGKIVECNLCNNCYEERCMEI